MTDRIDFNDENSNTSANPSFDSVLQARLSRRGLLRGGVGTMGATLLGGLGVAACGGGDDEAAPAESALMGFKAVAKSVVDTVLVPAGYTASVIYALGDPLTGSTAAYKNDGTDTDFENRAGDHHDGMEWFGLDASGKPSLTSVDRGLLAVNHEATTDEKLSSFFLHANGGTSTLPRPAAEVDKETAIHGISVVEVKKTGSSWGYVQNSSFNFRLTPLSNVELSGPARGKALMVTKYSIDGTRARGTLNNCGTGKTPWGSFLTGEENWAGYFTRNAGDDTARGGAAAKSVVSLKRYGRNAAAPSRHGWESAGVDDKYARWDISQGLTAAANDYRNELNTFGYIVEIDPYDQTRLAKKRTGLGRFAHESAAFANPVTGKPLAVYMGDDSRGEYIYKFVSTVNWDAADTNPISRVATGDKYLDNGKLYVAKFNPDGSGQWVELSLTNTVIATYTGYAFADQADVCVNSRLAADAVGATKMDRPEWCGVHPTTGEVYFTLTNSARRITRTDTKVRGVDQVLDAVNPRYYTDAKGSDTSQGNVNGHILRMKEGTLGSADTSFTWDVYVFGAQSDAGSNVNLSALTADNDFSSPDGLVFSPSTGIMWIQTDDGNYTDATNCMMLAAVPGVRGDGSAVNVTSLAVPANGNADQTVRTYVGKAPGTTLKRFLVGAIDSEITGLCETPDGKAMFINIQHPGEGTKMANIADPTKYTSQWPSNAGYGAGKRPRSATIVITKNDGGKIGT